MTTAQLEFDVRHGTGLATIDLRGEITAQAEPALSAAYDEATATDPARILLNFRGVPYINSAGIAVVVGLLAQARRERREVLACGLSDHYREIFEITRLSDVVRIYPDEASALAGDGVAAATS